MRMLGRLGWKGQCSCCNGPKDVRREEELAWRREAAEEIAQDHAVEPPGDESRRAMVPLTSACRPRRTAGPPSGGPSTPDATPFAFQGGEVEVVGPDARSSL